MGCIVDYYQRMSTLTPLECIEKLRELETLLNKMLDRYHSESMESKAMAKVYIRDSQPILAKACLKRCRLLDHQMSSIAQRISTCEQQRLSIEQMQSMQQQVDLMRDTTRTYKNYLKVHDIDKIENLQNTLKQAILDSCDITEVLTEDVAPELDEEELENELKSLMLAESINRSFPTTPEIQPEFERHGSELHRKGEASSPLTRHVSGRLAVSNVF